jgi:hypothetical protein
MSEHLSEEEIQEYVLNEQNNEHIQTCALCKAKVEAYQLLITAIEQEPPPVPDFDITDLVMAKLETKKTANGWIYVFMVTGLVISGAFIYLVRTDIAVLFNGISTFLIYLFAITGLFILIAMVADQYKTYKNKMSMLDTLQQMNQSSVS